ncbi:MAG: type II secretion system F family protein [Ilumatobacteraceae bacterium]
MPKFSYAAIDTSGGTVKGVQKATTIGDAREALIAKNLYPVKLDEKRGAMQFELSKSKVKKKELMHFTRQLAVFVKAGISLTEAMEIIGDETTDPALRRTVTTMIEDLRNGSTMSEAAATHPEAFPKYYMGILQSAEMTGKLDEALESLAGYLEREIEARAKVVAALSYPMVVMVMAVMTVAVLAGYVLPKFKPLFEELGVDLPLATRLLLGVATLFSTMVYIPLSAFFLFSVLMFLLFKTERGKPTKDRLMLKIPVLKGIVEYSVLERFCRILATMLRAGVPLTHALRTTTDALDNTVYAAQLAIAQEQILEGAGFARPLAETGLFPGAARQMFKVGEETGTLDQQLEVASTYFDRELSGRIQRFTAMFEPIMIIFVGAIVGFVAMALVSAMYGVLGTAK